MTDESLREQIAAEAARLLLRGKEQDFSAARKRAARWLRRKKLRKEDMPSQAEIQVQLYALAGVMAAERDPAVQRRQREFTADLMAMLAEFHPQVHGAVLAEEAVPGSEIRLTVQGSQALVTGRLRAAGLTVRRQPPIALDGPAPAWRLRVEDRFPALIDGQETVVESDRVAMNTAELTALLEATPSAAFEPPDDRHPDVYAVFQLLLEPLARVRMPPDTHAEGDALYHSLQVFELGWQQRPYDLEFLLACLLHDVGLAIDPHQPVAAALAALGTLITERTRFLIEHRSSAEEYLRTGNCPQRLRKSPDFEDAVLLARCDRAGRVAGARVRSLEDALSDLEAWDNECEGDEAEAS